MEPFWCEYNRDLDNSGIMGGMSNVSSVTIAYPSILYAEGELRLHRENQVTITTELMKTLSMGAIQALYRHSKNNVGVLNGLWDDFL